MEEGKEEEMEAEAAETAERGDQDDEAGGLEEVDEVLLDEDGWC